MKRYSFLGLFFCFIASTDLVYANSNFIGFLSVEEVHSLHQFFMDSNVTVDISNNLSTKIYINTL